MKKLCLIAFAGIVLPLQAQQSYSNIENFEPGDKITYIELTDSVNPGSPGKNQKWDFSGLKKDGKEVSQVIRTAGDAPFPGTGRNFDLVECNTDSSYVYLKKTADSLLMVGFYDAAQDFLLLYDSPMAFMKWPVVFGQRIESKSTRRYEVRGMKFIGDAVMTTEADGTGRLKLPGGTYDNVIRVKIEQVATDKDQTFGSSTTVRHTGYTWFDADHRHALLKMDFISITSSRYRSREYTVKYIKP